MAKVKTHTFNGVRYKIDVSGNTAGSCDAPTKKRRAKDTPEICLTEGLPCGNSKKAKNGLKYLMHESIHAEDWDMPENKVERIAEDITRLLWRLDYRRIKK